MDWTQAFAIIGAIGAFILWAFSKLDGDLKAMSQKIDGDIKAINQNIDGSIKATNQRTDQLYQMFIDLLKERR